MKVIDPRVLKYQPKLYHDQNEPFPVRYLGYTIFDEPGISDSFPGLVIDPAAEGAEYVIEYAVYYDYDIQHLYDLEHVWVAVNGEGKVCNCWSSFHGMRLRASGVKWFRMEETHPVLYGQPGKHAMMPDPELFGLHPDAERVCGEMAGGGLLIPPMLKGRMKTDAEQDRRICEFIREKFTFRPSLSFAWTPVEEENIIPWPELLERIPKLVEAQLALM